MSIEVDGAGPRAGDDAGGLLHDLVVHGAGLGVPGCTTLCDAIPAPDVIPQSKETKPTLPYVCPGSHITRTVTHHGKTDAMFDYLIRVLFSYINDPWVSKKNYRAANSGPLSVA
jgi:hypothetical protein